MNRTRIMNVVGLVVLIALVVPFVIYAVPGVVGADYSFVVLSGSMEPEIAPGDVVIVGETSPGSISGGDVITFVRSEGEKPVTHRVVGSENRDGTLVFETKGDANEDVDAELVPAENVLGTVTLTIPYIGHVIQFTQRPIGFVTLVLLPLLLLGLSEVGSLLSTGSSDEDGDGDEMEGTDAGGSDSTTLATGSVNGTTAAQTDTDDTATAGTGDVTITGTDLTLATGILALVAPYAVYVALQLRSPMTFTAAFAAGFSLLGVGSLWLTARGSTDSQTDDTRSGPADVPEVADNDEADWTDSAEGGNGNDWTFNADGVLTSDAFGEGFSDDFEAAFPSEFESAPAGTAGTSDTDVGFDGTNRPPSTGLDASSEDSPTDTEEVD